MNQAWACGENGTILFTSNGGATWTLQESGTTATLWSIEFFEVAGGPVVAVGDGGTGRSGLGGWCWFADQGLASCPGRRF